MAFPFDSFFGGGKHRKVKSHRASSGRHRKGRTSYSGKHRSEYVGRHRQSSGDYRRGGFFGDIT